jgi:hypothetical protein
MGLGGKKADEGRVRRSSPRVMIPGGDYKPTDVAYLQPCTVHWKLHYKSMPAPLTSSMQAGPASVESYVSWGIYIRVPLQFSRSLSSLLIYTPTLQQKCYSSQSSVPEFVH